MQDETILFDPATKRFCLLNGTAAFLWERLQQPCSVEQVSQDLCQSFDGADSGTVRLDVQAALEQLKDLAFVVTEA
jgi:coenzyme PQQ synthesis protein D (PqqD)